MKHTCNVFSYSQYFTITGNAWWENEKKVLIYLLCVDVNKRKQHLLKFKLCNFTDWEFLHLDKISFARFYHSFSWENVGFFFSPKTFSNNLFVTEAIIFEMVNLLGLYVRYTSIRTLDRRIDGSTQTYL